MNTTPAGYWAASQTAASERRRLELLEARYDALTFRRLDALGPAAGWSCLEVGAGAGSVARFLAERVGRAGRVIATDLDLRFLRPGDRLPSNVEVRQHDILTDPLEEGAFDLVHCRALLCHLDEPVLALTRMASALRPGGWLLVEDADYITLEAASPDHPLTPAWNRAAERITQTMAYDGVVDPRLGRRLPGLLAALGLGRQGHEGTVRIHQGASPSAEFLRHSLHAWQEQLESAVVISNVDLNGMLSALRDPSFSFVDSISYAAWGRRSLVSQ
jgi:SAM-dependent methyltransferase